ncbi:MAG: SDR family oxidoreductase, partial [Roseovarius sp.]
MDEQGRPVAIVTGGLVGIGRAIAQRLTADGMRVAVGARRGDNPAEQQAARAAIGPETAIHKLDVCDEASVATFCQQVAQQCGPVDVLVNAAGITHHQLVSEHDTAAWRDTIDTNLT